MKKLFFPLLSLCLLTTACKDSVPSPTIEMQGLYVNDGEMDYTRQKPEANWQVGAVVRFVRALIALRPERLSAAVP